MITAIISAFVLALVVLIFYLLGNWYNDSFDSSISEQIEVTVIAFLVIGAGTLTLSLLYAGIYGVITALSVNF